MHNIKVVYLLKCLSSQIVQKTQKSRLAVNVKPSNVKTERRRGMNSAVIVAVPCCACVRPWREPRHRYCTPSCATSPSQTMRSNSKHAADPRHYWEKHLGSWEVFGLPHSFAIYWKKHTFTITIINKDHC